MCYHIPKDSIIFLFTSAIHLDEKYYSEPFTFNPWHWKSCNTEDSKEEYLMPFGGGSRLCPGAQLAKIQIAIFLHQFVTKCRWNTMVKDAISCMPMVHFLKGFPIQVTSRE
ncbi:hypothetical protein SUGI_0476500 [Cryptomeria japonica]|nr:hypothetical protein SUGI_0476500 [Cryptomeria japonica]